MLWGRARADDGAVEDGGPSHVALNPFWSGLQETDIPLVTHVGTGGRLERRLPRERATPTDGVPRRWGERPGMLKKLDGAMQ